MEELNTIIKNYLEAKGADYAIMINGKWGCGKSYYIENELESVVSKVKVEEKESEDKDKKTEKIIGLIPKSKKEKFYKKAYVSLYGITNADDFHLHVAYGLNPILANNWVKKVGSIASRTAAFFNADIEVKDKSSLEFGLHSHVLVFDDLERISPELSVIDVMGWINAYVEHQKCKVIIVCNEGAIEQQSILNGDSRYKDYLQYKEKTVRFSYSYESDADKVYDALIEKKDTEEKEFYENNRGIILDLFCHGGEKNLRTLIFIIDCLYKVCKIAKKQNAEEEICKNLITTFVIYAMEHKRGATREQLNLMVPEALDWSKMQLAIEKPGPEVMGSENTDNEDDSPKEKPWKSLMGSTYLSQMYRMPELVEYIVTGNLNEAELKKSLDRQVTELKKQQETSQGKLLKELHRYENINDDEFLRKIAQLEANIMGNLYNMYELLDVYTVLMRFDFFKIQGFKITSEWDKLFFDACDKAAETHEYDSRFELCVPMWDPDDKSESGVRYNKLKAYAISWNNKCEQAGGREEAEKYIQAVKANDFKTLREYRKQESAISLVYNMDWEKLCKLVIDPKTTNPVASVVIDTIEYWVVKYGRNPEMWEPLYKRVSEYLSIKRQKNPLRVILLYPLQSSLKERVYGR